MIHRNSYVKPWFTLCLPHFFPYFTSYGSAEKEFKKLQGKAEREQRPYKVTLSRKDGRSWEELDKAEVKKSYYED